MQWSFIDESALRHVYSEVAEDEASNIARPFIREVAVTVRPL